MIEYNIRVNLQGERELYKDIVFTTGDSRGYQLNFAFYSYGERVDVSACGLTVKAKRSDGQVIIDSGVTKAAGAYYIVADNAYNVEGALELEIGLVGQDESLVTSVVLHCYVREGFGEGDLAPEDVTPILAKAAAAVEAADAAADNANQAADSVSVQVSLAHEATEAAQSAAVLAEDTAKAAESVTEKTEAAEQVRVSAEQARQLAEEGRVSAESGRTASEAERISSEGGRVQAESERVSAEGERKSAETERIAAEEEREQAEGKRQSGETQRISEETKRRAAEEERLTAEKTRQSAEKVRISEETKRVSSETERVSAEDGRVQAEMIRQENFESGRNQAANAFRRTLSGAVVSAGDVSPVSHEVSVRVSGVSAPEEGTVLCCGRNLLDIEPTCTFKTQNIIKCATLLANIKYNIAFEAIEHDATGSWSGMVLLLNDGSNTRTYMTEPGRIYTITPQANCTKAIIYSNGWSATSSVTATVSGLRLYAPGADIAEYEAYIEPVSYPVLSDGSVPGVKSISPGMTLTAEAEGAALECTYNRDSNAVYEELVNAIVAMGGNV